MGRVTRAILVIRVASRTVTRVLRVHHHVHLRRHTLLLTGAPFFAPTLTACTQGIREAGWLRWAVRRSIRRGWKRGGSWGVQPGRLLRPGHELFALLGVNLSPGLAWALLPRGALIATPAVRANSRAPNNTIPNVLLMPPSPFDSPATDRLYRRREAYASSFRGTVTDLSSRFRVPADHSRFVGAGSPSRSVSPQ